MARAEFQRPVMHDVARLAGVSHQTVSRVINNHPSVRPATRERVLAAMRQLDYRPNNLARSLVTKRTRRIGVLAFDVDNYGPNSTRTAIERAAHELGYGVATASVAGRSASDVVVAAAGLDDQRVDGLIVIAPHRVAVEAFAQLPRTVPVVALEAEFRKDVSVVAVDQRAGALMATHHLLELGHRTVWHVSGPIDWNEARLRVTGWATALAQSQRTAPPAITGDWTARSGYEAGLQLSARDGVTAVFVANDQMALGVLRAFHDRGIRVPDDVSVVGFDDIPEATYFIPALTTVRQNFHAVGRRGLEHLVDLIEGRRSRRRTELIEPTLVTRASAARPSGRR